MQIKRLDHASVRFSDLARSREFYEGLLGLSTTARPDLGFPGEWYAVGDSQLHLIADTISLEGIDPTARHLAFEVESVADVKRALETRGVPFLAFGETQLWVRDPDGNVIELCEPR
jgi:catechol 2,3-dioxygenase-like lactoylglutathione lyase family enzyme